MNEQTTEAVRVEYGVQWPGAAEVEQDEPRALALDGGKAYAERVARRYRADGATVARREVRYGAWTAAQ